MADIYRPSLRLRPSEQRTVLLLGDLIASAAATAGAVFFWYRYSLYRLIESGVGPNLAARIIQVEVPFWFYAALDQTIEGILIPKKDRACRGGNGCNEIPDQQDGALFAGS